MATLTLILLFYLFHAQLEALALPTSSDYDFSYMESVYSATDVPLEEEYDYIIVGGGTAGCSLASTLSKKYSVLVVERGGDPAAYPQVLSADGSLTNFLQEDDGITPAERFTSEDGVENARGRVLGGSSMINLGFYSRADDEFYQESGIQWDMSLVENAYRWVEETIVFQYNLSLWQSAAKEALLEAGLRPDNGFNLDHIVGTKASGSTFDEEGRRHGAVELLNRGELENLRVVVHGTVERIMLSSNASSNNLSAIGVAYTDLKNRSHRAYVRDKGEVILSAGAIGSPQLLLLSGVGPDSYLSSLQIPVVHPNPYVGKYMVDNPRNNINIVVPFTLDPSNAQIVGITNDFNYIETISYSLPFSFPLPFGLYPNSTSPIDMSVATIAGKVSEPLSTGSLRLASSSDVRVSPTVRFNYFDNPIDLASCVRGMRKVGDMLKTKALEPFKIRGLTVAEEGFKFLGPSLPDNFQSDDSSMESFCRKTVTTFWHYHGGCLVGKVVDGDLRVLGINALRVVDASTFKTSPGTNPQATIMMFGRYVGFKMLQEREEALCRSI
ncbi:hypothetical protein FNV43_RR03267 [Rhamnella rubrinervis]|uniref:(R)-mandelonitrile lyase n=1 Tax=Rhamnella rubrinervis TaxID=2594499 RepID=A0A8K0HJJ0_9ROSA|nr:hypothetical protein FNV43_RR03267 [Rhamnella rubrinervis]